MPQPRQQQLQQSTPRGAATTAHSSPRTVVPAPRAPAGTAPSSAAHTGQQPSGSRLAVRQGAVAGGGAFTIDTSSTPPAVAAPRGFSAVATAAGTPTGGYRGAAPMVAVVGYHDGASKASPREGGVVRVAQGTTPVRASASTSRPAIAARQWG